MLNRNPSNSSNVINSYRKRRQQKGPFLVYGAIALVIIGGIMLIIWLTGPGQPFSGLFPTETPTPTVTFTPTNTSAPTETPTTTLTPEPTVSPTPSAPFPYTIQENDSLDAIAQRFNLGEDGILLILDQNPEIVNANNGVIFVGQTILIPIPGTTRPSSTPIPASLGRGTLIEYRVLPGDTLAGIAASFNSIEQNIIDENSDVITNANALQVGDVLQIPVNLVTATATLPSTSTPVSPTVAGGQPTTAATVAAGASPVSEPAACEFEENAGFVTQLQTLINSERTSNSLSALTLNSQLSAAAKVHATDMLCYNYLSHTGFDSSTPETRVAAQGFTASLVVEDIYASKTGNPQTALDWWLSDPAHRADILNADTTAFGIAYVTSADSMLGGYFVVVSAKP
ncbi:MAG TPA: CAP domain-containing protein [Anaerolineales bacterium]|jgi:uncharacterized protein YkwD|nr:CAP domain-containing protein [Anaerolineales bacterium]